MIPNQYLFGIPSSECWLSRDVEVTIAIEVSICLEIAQAGDAATMNINIIDGDVLAASRATQNVVVPALICSCACHIPDDDVGDADTCCRVACWATVEIVLLDIDAVDRDVLYSDILKQNVVDVSGSVLVRLDTRTVLCVQNNGVAKDHVGHVVVRFATYRSDRQAMATIAVHVVD